MAPIAFTGRGGPRRGGGVPPGLPCPRSERKHGLSTEQFPASAYAGSSKNPKDLKDARRARAREGLALKSMAPTFAKSPDSQLPQHGETMHPRPVAARHMRSFTAIRQDAGLCCGSRLRKGGVFAYVESIQNLKDLKQVPASTWAACWRRTAGW